MFVFVKGSHCLIFLLFLLNTTKRSIANGLFTLSAEGQRLEESLLKETKAASEIHCLQQCLREDPHCKSVNYGVTSKTKGKCQLNNATVQEEYNSKKLVADKDFNYFEKVVEDDLTSSVILERGQNYLSKLKEWLDPFNVSVLCYRASEHGWGSSDFHSRCDNKGPTVTIVLVGSYVFGGYADKSWGGSSRWISSTQSFIFSLKNKDNLAPFKAPVYQNSQHAMYTASGQGPTFGEGNDLYISDNANSNSNSYTNLGLTYRPPPGYFTGSSNTRALLAGSYYFIVSEIEVYYLR